MAFNSFFIVESSESESSSSSSEEEEEGSLDSRDIGPIRLDPNICPEGCDRDVYDKTFDLRNLRWTHEQSMMEMDRLVEQLKRDIDAHNKIKRKLSVQLDKRKNELREFMVSNAFSIFRYPNLQEKVNTNIIINAVGETKLFERDRPGGSAKVRSDKS